MRSRRRFSITLWDTGVLCKTGGASRAAAGTLGARGAGGPALTLRSLRPEAMAAVRGRAAGPLIKPPRLGGTGPPRAPEPRGLGRAAPRRGMYALKIRGEREGRGEGEGKKGRGGRPPAPPTSPSPPAPART